MSGLLVGLLIGAIAVPRHDRMVGVRADGPTADAVLAPGTGVDGASTLRFGPVSFSRDRHNGADQQRTSRWSKDCTCFKALTPFAPLFVP